MSSDSPELAAALLQFINSFDVAKHENTWLDIRDGGNLWQILTIIAPAFFVGGLPKPLDSKNWVERWQNLKHIDRMVMKFIRDECGKLQEWTKIASADLKAIAIGGSEKDCIQLVKTIVIASVFSPEANQHVVNTLEKLGPQVSKPIAVCIEQTILLDQSIAVEVSASRLESPMQITTIKRDVELQDEQQLIEAFEQINNLEAEKQRLQSSLQETRLQRTELQTNLQKLSQELDSSKTEDFRGKMFDQLLQRSEQDRDHIATLEKEVIDLKNLNSAQVKQLDDLLATQESKRKLHDEVQSLQAERNQLLQKGNANDNLKKKIVALQEAAKSSELVRQEYDAAQEELRSLRRTKDRCAELQKSNEEQLRVIENSEHELMEELRSRQSLEQEVQKLTDSLEMARSQRQMDVERLQEAVRELEASNGLDSNELRNLGDELHGMDSNEDLRTENEQLKAELTRLRVARDLIHVEKSENDSEETSEEGPESADDTNNKILQLIKEGEDALQHANMDDSEQQATGHTGATNESDTDSTSTHSSHSLHSDDNPDSATTDANIQDNLRRELRLMTSAWYDVTRRIQSDAVIVQRRREAPKSFLNRQRKLVLGVGTGVGAPGQGFTSSLPQKR